MKPPFHVLRCYYPQIGKREALYEQIGWDDVVNHPAFLDTCAIRMSMGLLGAGVKLPGARMKAKAGLLKGKSIEPGQTRLSRILARIWGKPEVFENQQSAYAASACAVALFRSFGYMEADRPAGGGFFECARSCYFSAGEIWFWEL